MPHDAYELPSIYTRKTEINNNYDSEAEEESGMSTGDLLSSTCGIRYFALLELTICNMKTKSASKTKIIDSV